MLSRERKMCLNFSHVVVAKPESIIGWDKKFRMGHNFINTLYQRFIFAKIKIPKRHSLLSIFMKLFWIKGWLRCIPFTYKVYIMIITLKYY